MSTAPLEAPPDDSRPGLWALDPAVTFLNHGSFGACPTFVLEAQQALRARLEAQPVRFFLRELQPLWDRAREALAAFLGAGPRDLVFVPNATHGVNAVLRSLRFRPGDELLTTDHAYGACQNALAFAAERDGARVVTAPVPLPLRSPDDVVAAVLAQVTPRTRLALLDHVTSPTGIVFPIGRLVQELAARGVDTLVDGAHGPGMLEVDLEALGAAYYTGNCHKWLCAPKGAAFLHVRADRQAAIRPLAISHGATAPSPERSRFQAEFDWTGTADPTPYLCVPTALEYLERTVPGGWAALRVRNHALAVHGRRVVAGALGAPPLCPDGMLGSLAAVPLPDGPGGAPRSPLLNDPLHDALERDYGLEVPVFPWPAPPRRLVRLSAQLYNRPSDYQRLAGALLALLPAEKEPAR